MNESPFLGVLFHWISGFAFGSLYVPYRCVKKWAWEVYWLVGSVFSWVLVPWILALSMTKDLIGVLVWLGSSSPVGRRDWFACDDDMQAAMGPSPRTASPTFPRPAWAASAPPPLLRLVHRQIANLKSWMLGSHLWECPQFKDNEAMEMKHGNFVNRTVSRCFLALALLTFTASPGRTEEAAGRDDREREAATALVEQAPESRPRSIVGAIRWDAWHGDAGLGSGKENFTENGMVLTPGMVVERSLSPKHWHYRLPFYAKIVGENKVEARANTQEVMDQEITYASRAQLDYWAFLTYDPKSPMSIGMNLYLSSSIKSKVKFCVILHHVRQTTEEVDRIVQYMKDKDYVQVLGNRPLLYASCWAQKPFYDALIRAAGVAGLGQPYLVNMGNFQAEVGFDAVSSYLGYGSGPWDEAKKNGRKVIPTVSAGFDRRPRVENPVPWEGGGKGSPVEGGPLESSEVSAANIAANVASALEWNKRNPEAGEANAVIIYAWNEFDEGGWICPTLSEGTARLDAIQAVLTSGVVNK